MGADHIADKAHITQELTTFAEDANISQDQQYVNTLVPNPYPTESIIQWLSRPFPLKHVRWSSSSNVGDLLASASFPSDLFAIDTLWDKVKNFRYFRANVKIAIRMNGTKMHYGKLIAMWSPYSTYNNTTFERTSNIYAVSGFPHVVISPTENEVNELVIPFMSPLTYSPINPGVYGDSLDDYIRWQFGGLYIYVLNTLQNTNGGATDVSFSIFANFEDIQLAGYTTHIPTQPSPSQAPNIVKCMYPIKNEVRAQAKRVTRHKAVHNKPTPVKEAEDKAKQGVVGTTLEKVGNIASSLTAVPVIGSVAAIVSPVADALGSIANIFGWNKPDSLEPRGAIVNRYIDSVLTHGVDTSMKLALLPDNCVSSGLPFLGNNCKMDFESICATPMLIGIYTWQPTDTEGENLLQVPVTPAYEFSENFESGLKYYPTYLSHVARAFTYWRGDLRYYIQVTASAFHSGRLRVWYEADDNYNPTNGINGSNIVSKVIDIQTETDLAFTVPYLSHTPYRTVRYENPYRVSQSSRSSKGDGGRIGVAVLNELTSSTVPIQPVFINVWVSGVNMQFGAPTDVVFDSYKTDPILAQGITSESIAKMEYHPMIQATSSMEDGVCMGEHADHVKDLIMRPCPILHYHETSNPPNVLEISRAYNYYLLPNFNEGEFDFPLIVGKTYEYRIWGQSPDYPAVTFCVNTHSGLTDATIICHLPQADLPGQEVDRPLITGRFLVDKIYTHFLVDYGPVAVDNVYYSVTFTEIKSYPEDRPVPDPQVPILKTTTIGKDITIQVPNPFFTQYTVREGDSLDYTCPYASYLAYFGAIYRFWRGSVRYKLFEVKGRNFSTKAASLIHSKMHSSEKLVINNRTANFTRGFHQGLTSVRDPVSNALEVTVPFYSEFLCRIHTPNYRSAEPMTVKFDLVQDKYSESSEAEGYILSSAGDDFEFGFLVPPPFRTIIDEP